MNQIKTRLAALNFLEFAVWGAYLTSLGSYLANIGMATQIAWFYAVQGFVSIFMPALVGIVADRWIPAQKMLALCQVIAGAFMCAAALYAQTADVVQFAPLFSLYTVSVAFFMPTIGLCNSVNYSVLNRANLDPVTHFPPIRTLGTVGFIISMLFVNFTGYQNTYAQLYTSGLLSFVLAFFALSAIPNCPIARKTGKVKVSEALGLNAFKLFADKRMATFFVFSMLLGVALQVSNGFANPIIQSFENIPEFAGTWRVYNANALISLSQISEALCILLITFFLKRFGIKIVMLMAMLAWVLRFGFFGLGNPGEGVWLFILSMIVYGIAFDFFNVSGSLFVDQQTDSSIRSSAQGLFMLMTNGIGASVGTLVAQRVINYYVYSQPEGLAQAQGWSTSWFIFAGYALVVAILFAILFRYKHTAGATKMQIKAAEAQAAGDPEI